MVMFRISIIPHKLTLCLLFGILAHRRKIKPVFSCRCLQFTNKFLFAMAGAAVLAAVAALFLSIGRTTSSNAICFCVKQHKHSIFFCFALFVYPSSNIFSFQSEVISYYTIIWIVYIEFIHWHEEKTVEKYACKRDLLKQLIKLFNIMWNFSLPQMKTIVFL